MAEGIAFLTSPSSVQPLPDSSSARIAGHARPHSCDDGMFRNETHHVVMIKGWVGWADWLTVISAKIRYSTTLQQLHRLFIVKRNLSVEYDVEYFKIQFQHSLEGGGVWGGGGRRNPCLITSGDSNLVPPEHKTTSFRLQLTSSLLSMKMIKPFLNWMRFILGWINYYVLMVIN